MNTSFGVNWMTSYLVVFAKLTMHVKVEESQNSYFLAKFDLIVSFPFYFYCIPI